MVGLERTEGCGRLEEVFQPFVDVELRSLNDLAEVSKQFRGFRKCYNVPNSELTYYVVLDGCMQHEELDKS